MVGLMDTMQMKPIIPCLITACALWTSPEVLAQSADKVISTMSGTHYSGAEFDDFVARAGWIFIEDQTKGGGFPDLDGVPARVEGGAPFRAVDFNPAAFDPRNYVIVYEEDVMLPTNFRVGNRGMLQFHSPQRCQDLYERHLARKAKGQ